ncbi:hypothetical protein SUGI_0549980 [Cryptomeria japonica]|nr:hypothetical protein SUGI_0549980 [Cryptomeria japonica]
MVKIVKIVIQISTHRRINGIGGIKKINFIQSMDNYAGRGSSGGSIVSTRGEHPSIDFKKKDHQKGTIITLFLQEESIHL